MVNVIGVKFKTSGRVYYFDPLGLDVHKGDGVIVETARGLEFGEAVLAPTEVEEKDIVAPLKPVQRIATAEDIRLRDENAAKEADAFRVCQEKIAKHALDMKLVDVEYTFNGSKIVFYFTADERVDFRELVKDLAYVFRTRIELRQIGVRDEAKMLGGLGSCGRPVCCKTFLDDFRPVSIKMAKEQNLSLSPTKISGLCGRLMCCLQYEQAAYESMRKQMPKTGKTVVTVDGTGTVVENNVITERTRVRLMLPDGTVEVKEYPFTHIAPEGEPLPACAIEAAAAKQQQQQAENLSARPAPRPSRQQPRQRPQQPKAEGDEGARDAQQQTSRSRPPRPQQRPQEGDEAKRQHGQRPQQRPAQPKPAQDVQRTPQRPTQPKPVQDAQKTPPVEGGEQAAKKKRPYYRRRRGKGSGASGGQSTPAPKA